MLQRGSAGALPCRRSQHALCQHLCSSSCTTTNTVVSKRLAPVAKVASAAEPAEAVTATRQTYIQESLSFSGAELAARLPSMQAALRAQRTAADAAAAAAAPAAAPANGKKRPAAARAASRSPAPPVTRPGPHPAAAAVAAAAASSGPSPAAPYSSRPYNGSTSVASAAASATASTLSAPTLQLAEVGAPAGDSDSAALQEQEQQEQQQQYGSSDEQPSPSSSVSESPAAPPAPPMVMPGDLQGMSASEKLQALQQVQQVSQQALTQLPRNSPYYANAPKTIDIRMYDQLVAAHNKLSKRLSDNNAHVAVLEGQISQCNDDLIAAFELLKQIAMEFGTTSRLAQGTAAAVQFGVDPQDALDKISKLQERLSTLEQAVLEQRAEFGKRVVRKVPVEWIGVASEVRVMGDFDGWTRGHELSAEDVASDSVYSRFEGTLPLRPGTYRVKFLVDNEWRLAADWPTERDSEGNEVCLLTVT